MKQHTQQQLKFINENFQQGQRAIQMGMFGRAEKYFADIIKIAPEIVEAQNALALTYAASKQHDKAAAQFKIILRAKPNDAHTHHNLANTLYELSQFDEAIQHYQTALKINPNLVDSNIHCGIAYRAIKNYEEAIRYLHQALNLDKKSARAFHILGAIYAEIDDYPRALECHQNASGLAPQNISFNISYAELLSKVDLNINSATKFHEICLAHPNQIAPFLSYGDQLIKMRYYDEALECFERALQLGANDNESLEKLGFVYYSLGNFDMASNTLQTVLDKSPNRISTLTLLENTYQDAGKLDEAINVCDKIIALNPRHANGYILKSSVAKSKPGDKLVAELHHIYNQNDLDDDTKIQINFALGKLYDDQKNYEQAFKYFADANTLRNNQLTYDHEHSMAGFSKLINTFSHDFFEKNKGLGVASDLPIFIVGMPRSATTLTEQIISSHHDVLGAGEVDFWAPSMAALHRLMNTDSKYPECVEFINDSHAKEIADLYENTLHKIVGINAKPKHITDKMPHNFMQLGMIAMLFPNAKIIHTKRDPIDTCLSIFFQNFNNNHPYSFNLRNLGLYYKQYERLMQHWHKVLPGRILDINYADTIADPEYWTRKLISHVGLEWDDACLAPHKLERAVKTPSHWQVRQPIYKTSVERWRNYEQYIQPLIETLSS